MGCETRGCWTHSLWKHMGVCLFGMSRSAGNVLESLFPTAPACGWKWGISCVREWHTHIWGRCSAWFRYRPLVSCTAGILVVIIFQSCHDNTRNNFSMLLNMAMLMYLVSVGCRVSVDLLVLIDTLLWAC